MSKPRKVIIGLATIGGGFFLLMVVFCGSPYSSMLWMSFVYSNGVRPGQSMDEVQAWLTSKQITYGVQHRREDVTFKGWWMDVRGRSTDGRAQTVAELAGLNVDDVYSVIKVMYQRRSLLGRSEIMVCLFFDDQGRFIKHFIAEYHSSL